MNGTIIDIDEVSNKITITINMYMGLEMPYQEAISTLSVAIWFLSLFRQKLVGFEKQFALYWHDIEGLTDYWF